MRDGKLLKTERVKSIKRAEAFRELEEADLANQTARIPNSGSERARMTDWSNTQIRSSSDYKMFQVAVPRPTVAKRKA